MLTLFRLADQDHTALNWEPYSPFSQVEWDFYLRRLSVTARYAQSIYDVYGEFEANVWLISRYIATDGNVEETAKMEALVEFAKEASTQIQAIINNFDLVCSRFGRPVCERKTSSPLDNPYDNLLLPGVLPPADELRRGTDEMVRVSRKVHAWAVVLH